MTICLVYNLARWYLVTQHMKCVVVESESFHKTVKNITISLVFIGILLAMTELIKKIALRLTVLGISALLISATLIIAYLVVFH